MAKKAATKKAKEEIAPALEAVSVPEMPGIDPHQFEGLKSMYAIAQNFKNIEMKVVAIGGKSIMVVGRNEAGKSSLLQLLKGTLDSSFLPHEGLKEGTESGKITHRIAGNINGEYHDYIIDYHFDVKHRSGRIKVYDKDMNEVKSGPSIIKSLIGNTTFSITKWMNEPPRIKRETLKKASGRAVEIDLVNVDIAAAAVKLKAKKDRADILDVEVNKHGIPREVIEAHQKPIPLEPLQQELSSIAQVQAQFDAVRQQHDLFHTNISQFQTNITEGENEINRLADEITRIQNRITEINTTNAARREKIPALQNNILEAQRWMASNPRPDTLAVSDKMTAAINHNNVHTQVIAIAEKHKELYGIISEMPLIENEIINLEAKRAKILAESQLPVPGLTITDEEVLLDGRPFDDLQVNSQRKWHVSVQIAKALNPRYKGIFIDDGSLFDKAHLEAVVQEIEKDGYFAIIEMVDYNGGELEVRFTEQEFKV
jgi:predicted ATP-dependent endonuclease of OLD family